VSYWFDIAYFKECLSGKSGKLPLMANFGDRRKVASAANVIEESSEKNF